MYRFNCGLGTCLSEFPLIGFLRCILMFGNNNNFGSPKLPAPILIIFSPREGSYHDGAHIKFTVLLNSLQSLGKWKAISLHKYFTVFSLVHPCVRLLCVWIYVSHANISGVACLWPRKWSNLVIVNSGNLLERLLPHHYCSKVGRIAGQHQ